MSFKTVYMMGSPQPKIGKMRGSGARIGYINTMGRLAMVLIWPKETPDA